MIKYTRKFILLFFLMFLLFVGSVSLGVRYVQNHYPKEQNEGFYPLIETLTVGAYSENVLDKSVASYTTIFLQKAYQKENDAYKFSTDNHPNPFNKMNSNKPIKIGNISVTYGDKIPFIINGTSAEIIEQELRIQILIVNKNGENVYDQEYVIIQNQTNNILERSLEFILYPENLNIKFETDDSREEDFSIFYGIKQGRTLSNATQRYGIFIHGSAYIDFDLESDAFIVSNLGPKPDHSEFSILWYDKLTDTLVIVGIGTLFLIISIIVILDFIKIKRLSKDL